jgi:hypothetical protein
MYKIITLIFLTSLTSAYAENNNILFNQKWGAKEYYALAVVPGDQSQKPGIKEYYFANKPDSLRTNFYVNGKKNNIHYLDGMEYDFKKNGTLILKQRGLQQNKSWSFSNSGKTFNIDNIAYEFVSLNSDAFILGTKGGKYGIELYSYIVLSPVKSLIVLPPSESLFGSITKSE